MSYVISVYHDIIKAGGLVTIPANIQVILTERFIIEAGASLEINSEGRLVVMS